MVAPAEHHRTTAAHVVVVGAGITGLVAARALVAAGAQVTVLEAADQVGGQLDDVEVAGHRVDVGAESVFTAAPGPLELIGELGLDDDLVAATRATTWLATRHGLRPLPEGFTPAGPSRLAPVLRSRVLSPRGMLRAGLEPLVAATPTDRDSSVGDELARRFGAEVVDRLVDPLLGGLHAGDVRRLSLRSATPQLAMLLARHRSLLLRRRPAPSSGPAFVSLAGGMRALPEAVAAALPTGTLHLGARVTGVTGTDGRLRVHLATPLPGVGSDHLDADGVVLTTTTAAAAPLVAGASPDAAATLGQLRAASVALAVLAYPRAAASSPAIEHGTGVLVPSSAPGLLKAATFLTTKWPHHRDDELVLVRASAGRAGDDRSLGLDDAALVDALHRELAELTGLGAPPVATAVRRWPVTMPQLEVGHADRLAAIESALDRDLPGVVVAGAPYHGPGLSSCLRSAARAVSRLPAGLSPPAAPTTPHGPPVRAGS